jgi:hypothetical protein
LSTEADTKDGDIPLDGILYQSVLPHQEGIFLLFVNVHGSAHDDEALAITQVLRDVPVIETAVAVWDALLPEHILEDAQGFAGFMLEDEDHDIPMALIDKKLNPARPLSI